MKTTFEFGDHDLGALRQLFPDDAATVKTAAQAAFEASQSAQKARAQSANFDTTGTNWDEKSVRLVLGERINRAELMHLESEEA